MFKYFNRLLLFSAIYNSFFQVLQQGTSQSSFQGTDTNGAPPGIKIEVSIDEAIMALGRKNDGTMKDVITHGRTTIMH